MVVVSISSSMFEVLFNLLTWSLKAAMILAAASIMNPEYVPTDWQTFLLTVFIMIIHACLSSMVRILFCCHSTIASSVLTVSIANV